MPLNHRKMEAEKTKPSKKYYNTDITDEETLTILRRLDKMKARRVRYEEMWRQAIFSFIAFAIYEGEGFQRQFDPNVAPELQSYYNNRYSALGFKFTDTRYPLEFAVVMRKMAAEIPNLPNTKWIIDNEKDQSPTLLWKEVYDNIMYEADTDFELFELWLSKNVFGTAFTWSRLEESKFKVKEPNVDDSGNLTWHEEEKTSRTFKWSSVDIRNVLIDEGCKKTSLEDCDDCAVIEYLSEDKAKEIYSDTDFDAMGIKPVAPKYCFQDVDSLFGGDQKLVYEMINYYNVRTDSYTKVLNGNKIGETSGIPMKTRKDKKMLPIAMLVDHKIPNSPYGYGEPAITRPFREVKNKLRNLIFDVTKKTAKPTIAVDPLSPFSEEKYVWGEDFIRVAPRDMQPIPITANLDPALQLDKITDNDIIITSGVNILDTAQSREETATKTVVRKESQVAVVELGMQFNTSVGLKRLHTINANIILLYLKTPDFDNIDKASRTVALQDKQIFKGTKPKGKKYIQEKAQGTFIFTYKGDDLDYTFTPVVELGNLAITKGVKKELFKEGVDMMVANAKDALDQDGLAAEIAEEYEISDSVLRKKEEMPLNDDPDIMAQKMGAFMPPQAQLSNQNKLDKNAQATQLNKAMAAGEAPAGAVGGSPEGASKEATGAV